MTISRVKRKASILAMVLSMVLMSLYPVATQALQPEPLAADWATPMHSEQTSPALTMDASLLAAGLPTDRERTTVAQASSGESAPAPGGGGIDLEALSSEMDNPLGKLWLLFLQNDTMIYDGDPLGEEVINMTVFMPVLSIPVGPKFNLVVRPILLFISAPKPMVSRELGRFPDDVHLRPGFRGLVNLSTDRRFEFGDMMLMTAFGPSGLVLDKFVMGLGPTFMFPTASST